MIAFVNGITARVVSMELNQCVALVSDWEKIGKVRIAAALSVWIGSPLEIREIGSKSVLEFSRKARLQYAR